MAKSSSVFLYLHGVKIRQAALGKRRTGLFNVKLLQLYYGLRDQRTPFYAGIPAVISIIYLLSPIDLIPDFIPFFGYLDDLLIVPFLLKLSFQLLPAEVQASSFQKARKHVAIIQVIGLLLVLVSICLIIAIYRSIVH